LSGCELARLIAHLLGEMREVIGSTLAFGDHLVDIGCARLLRLLIRRAGRVHVLNDVAHIVGLLFLAIGQFLGFLCHAAELARGILLLDAAKQIGSLAKAIRGAAGIGGRTVGRAAHIVISLAQPFERLFGGLLTAAGGFLSVTLAGAVEIVFIALLSAICTLRTALRGGSGAA
jgi:hypothetical protein